MSAIISHLLRRAFSSSAAKPSSASHVIYKEQNLEKVVETFKRLTQSSKFRNKAPYYEHTVLRLSNSKNYALIEEILEEQKKYKDITDEGFTVRLISLYGKSGMFDHARKLFDEMPELKCARTVKSFNALLGACVGSKKFDKVEGLFRELPEKLSIKRDVVSYNNLIKAYCEMGSLDSAVSLLDEMEKEGLSPVLITFNILLDAFYKKDRFLDGEKVWVMMEKKYNVVPDIISYNARLSGLVLENKLQEAVDFVQGIITKEGLNPDVFTFSILFKGLCSDGKYIEETKRLYDEMLRTKCTPNRQTLYTLLKYACDNNDFHFGGRLCRTALYRRFRLNKESFQTVVDGLVKQSNFKDAEMLVRLGKESEHSCYHSLKISRFEK